MSSSTSDSTRPETPLAMADDWFMRVDCAEDELSRGASFRLKPDGALEMSRVTDLHGNAVFTDARSIWYLGQEGSLSVFIVEHVVAAEDGSTVLRGTIELLQVGRMSAAFPAECDYEPRP